MLSDRAVQMSTAKVYVFSDSVLCLGRIDQHSQAIDKWKEKIQRFINSPEYRELHRKDREPVVFEWKISQDTQRCRYFKKSKR